MPAWTAAIARQTRELRRRRVFRAVGAYLVLGWLLLQVADVTFEPLGLPAWSQRALIFAVAAGLVPAFVLAWIFDLRGRKVVRTGALDAPDAPPPVPRPVPAPAAATPAAFSPIAAVAILPFADLSQERDQGWFADGLAEEIIDSLCCVRGLRVASRSAAFRFRDGGADPREVGRQLAVDAVLEGSVRKVGDTLRVSAQLVDAASGFHLWTEAFERRMEDVFAIQTQIARQVASALRVSAGAPALGRSERYAPRNVEAYEYYLRGRQLMGQTTQAAWDHAPLMFRRAIELDPGYAQAHAGLADSIAQRILWRYADADALPEAAAAASRALDLAPDLAEAHVAQGHVRSLAGDAAGAIRAFERAIELNPELHEAYYFFARHLFAQGDYARAARNYEQAWRTRPDDASVMALAVNSFDASGDKAGADAMGRRALAGLLHQAELEPENARARYLAAALHLRFGDKAAGCALIEQALRLRPDDYAALYNAACFHAQAGDTELALDLLEEAARSGGGYRDWIANDPDLRDLRGHARFRALLETMG